MSHGLARRLAELEAARGGAGGAGGARSGDERDALAEAPARLGRAEELDDRLGRLRAGEGSGTWADGGVAPRRLVGRILRERRGLVLLPGDEDEVA